MAKPLNPIESSRRSLDNAINALDRIVVSTGIKGTSIKLGSEVCEDPTTVTEELEEIKYRAEELASGIKMMLQKIKEVPSGPVTRSAEVVEAEPEEVVATSRVVSLSGTAEVLKVPAPF